MVVEIVSPRNLHRPLGLFSVLLPLLGQLGTQNIQIFVVQIERESEIALMQLCENGLSHLDMLVDHLYLLLELVQVVNHHFLIFQL